MTIGYRVMGSGPGPERIGSGRHRLCGARVLSASVGHAGMFALSHFFVCLDTAELPLQAAFFARSIAGCASARGVNPEPSTRDAFSRPTVCSLGHLRPGLGGLAVIIISTIQLLPQRCCCYLDLPRS